MTKIQLKRSNVLEGGKAKEPSSGQTEYGELCVNYNENDPSLFIKDNNNNIVKVAGKDSVSSPDVGDGKITIKQPGSVDQTFTVNQSGDTVIDLKNDNTVVTPGDGIITIKQPGISDQSFTVNQTGSTIINLKNDDTIVTPGDGLITIKQPGVADQSFTVNQSGNTQINLRNDNTVVTPGDGSLTIRTSGEGANSTGSYTANQSGPSILTLPAIRYQDISGTPSIPAAAGNGTITITQPGTVDQSFTVNQTGNTTIALRNDNSQAAVGDGTITIRQPGTSDQTFTVNQDGDTTIDLKNDNTVVTPGDGSLTIQTSGEGAKATGFFSADQSIDSTMLLPPIRYSDLTGKPTIPTVGNGALTIKTAGEDKSATGSYNANQSTDSIIILPTIRYQDLSGTPTIPSVGNGSLTIRTSGEGANSTGSYTANQSGASIVTLPPIRYQDLSGTPSIPAAAGNGTITITQPGTEDQTFTVNQGTNQTIALRNDNTVNTPGNGTITITQPGTEDQTFTVNQGVNQTIALKNDNTVVTPGDGSLTIRTAGEGANSSGTFTANQSGASILTLPPIRYEDISETPVTERGTWTPAFANAGSIIYSGQFGYYSHVGDRKFINCRIDWENGDGNTNDVAIEVPYVQRAGTVAATGSCTFIKLPSGNALENIPVIPTIFPESNLIKFIRGGFQTGALGGSNTLKYDNMTRGDIRLSIIIND